MNRLAAAAVIVILCISAAVGGYKCTVGSVREIKEAMEAEREKITLDSLIPAESTKKIEAAWHKKEKLLVSLLPHGELENIEIGILNLSDYAAQKLNEEYIKTLNECINRLEHIEETEKPDLKNIF